MIFVVCISAKIFAENQESFAENQNPSHHLFFPHFTFSACFKKNWCSRFSERRATKLGNTSHKTKLSVLECRGPNFSWGIKSNRNWAENLLTFLRNQLFLCYKITRIAKLESFPRPSFSSDFFKRWKNLWKWERGWQDKGCHHKSVLCSSPFTP